MEHTLVFSTYVQGASHKPDKPCQDFAEHYSCEDYDIITLSDGHGGNKYFRSQEGSRIAVEITIETLKRFCDNPIHFDEILGEEETIKNGVLGKKYFSFPGGESSESKIRHLFLHITAEWHKRIREHFRENPLTRGESQYLEENKDNHGNPLKDYYFDATNNIIEKHLPSAYGCTLFGVAVLKNNYWIAFQIGDGKCVTFYNDGSFAEPIPWDDKCFQNLTTSLSHDDYDDFRYIIGKNAPQAIFVASDGMDDSYSNPKDLALEYVMQFLAPLYFNNIQNFEKALPERLDKISEHGSKDDMSVAYIVKKDALYNVLEGFYNRNIPQYQSEEETAERKYQEAFNKKLEIENTLKTCDQKITEAETNLKELLTYRKDLIWKISDLRRELSHLEDKINEYKASIPKGMDKYLKDILKDDYSKVTEITNDIFKLEQAIKDNNIKLDFNYKELEKAQDNKDSQLGIYPVIKTELREAKEFYEFIKRQCQRLKNLIEKLSSVEKK